MHICASITFHFSEDRISFLNETVRRVLSLNDRITLAIFTNIIDHECLSKIKALQSGQKHIEVITPSLLGHPYLLTWSHLDWFRNKFNTDNTITHFLYLEDDIAISKENIEYWLEGRSLLAHTNFYPSFLRYEYKADSLTKRYSSDVTKVNCFFFLPKTSISENYTFVNVSEPYQGLYFLDRILAEEHFFGPSSNPDFGDWFIREKAAQALTFKSVPKGFTSRNLIGVRTDLKQMDPRCLVHHMPNNYADNVLSTFGKINIEDVISFDLLSTKSLKYKAQRHLLITKIRSKNLSKKVLAFLKHRNQSSPQQN